MANRSATPGARFCVHATDLLFASFVYLLVHRWLHATPSFHLKSIFLALGAAAGAWIALRLTWRQTPGIWFWGLRLSADSRSAFAPMLQSDLRNPKQIRIGSILTLSLFVATGVAGYPVFFSHPLWSTVGFKRLEPFLPPVEPGSDWSIASFYYSVGAWPIRFKTQPVFYSFPYEKGPPQQFPGRIIARWEPPSTELIFEGPKSPSPAPARAEIEKCLVYQWAPFCRQLRQSVLLRHVTEMETLNPTRWEIRWFKVFNASIPPEEQPQGIFLSGSNPEKGQDRYILITARGTHQTFILNYGNAESAREARETLENSIRTLRVTDDLNPGRAWIDRRLESVRLAQITRTSDSAELIARLAEIELLLLSKISVDPAGFDAYYHLGGVGITLKRHGKRNPELAKLADWSAIAQPLLQSSYRYAMDVASQDPRTIQLQNFLLEK